ncbi:ATP-binding protein [Paenibacillus enshidis]|uniref:ATP-binding protein n=1 Tax=Paenibacillus enshidis TaxID=1458439 RepID=A0ABV5AVJ2_9BACL
MTDLKIPKRVTTAIINSLTAGVVPRIGLEYVAVGRKQEIEAILRDMDSIAEGGAAFRLITGRYGSGKSFLLQTIRNYAMDREFVVADADLSPERRLVGSKGQGIATYRELISRLSTKTRPDGGALEIMIQKWVSSIQQAIMTEEGLLPDDPAVTIGVEQRIYHTITQMHALIHGFDFGKVLATYWSGYKLGDDEKRQAALRWLRGEYSTRTEARKELGVTVIIDDDSWYDYVKLWAEFSTRIGYKGLLLMIDEGVNLYKITNAVSRQGNYEKLLSMFNDTMQGKARHLGIYIGGTPQFLEDERRGLFSYEALRSRLVEGRFSEAGYQNYVGPLIRLNVLSHEEILILLQKLKEIHALHFGYLATLSNDQLVQFMQMTMNRLGADELLTLREVIRDFLDLLHTLRQNPDIRYDDLLQERSEQNSIEPLHDEMDQLLEEFEL